MDRDPHFTTSLLRKLRHIKDGEFPRLFKHREPKPSKESGLVIPRKQIDKFEELKRIQLLFGTKSYIEGNEEAQAASKNFVKRDDFDRIMWNRERLRRARHGFKDEEYSVDAQTLRNGPGASATKKINEGKLRDWVDKCYDTIHNAQPAQMSKDVKRLARGDAKHNEADIVHSSTDNQETDSLVSLDTNLSHQDAESSSVLSEMVLRQKAKSRADLSRSSASEMGTRWDSRGRKRADQHLTARKGVNVVLEDFYIEDLKELQSLAYNEELYAYNKTNGQIVGSWRVNSKVCEDKDDCINVQFEGLIGEPHQSNWVMYSNGIVDKTFTPITEFRIEQKIEQSGASRSKIMFFHEKQRKWLFDVRETAGKCETRKTFTANYQHMQRVLSESAHLLLVRKAIMYRYPLNFEENDDEYIMPYHRVCICSEAAGGCACRCNLPLKIRKKFRLKMKALSIGGDIVRCNYRFYTPVNVKFNHVDLKVVRVRRRAEMPGKLIHTSNYFITTAGQLMAVTFNDPYPYETHYYLQIDPKSVLDPSRVLPPERTVPLRERYMCDPELRQFYESEVHRFTLINRSYLHMFVREFNAAKAVFQDLLNDKPHRIHDYVRDFFPEGYRFEGKQCESRKKRRRMKESRDEDDTYYFDK